VPRAVLPALVDVYARAGDAAVHAGVREGPADAFLTSLDKGRLQNGHPGGAHGERIDPGVVALARGADLLIHDAQYTPGELKAKRGWGHSSWEQAIEVALEAKVGQLALFHHDPEHDDAFLLGVESDCQRLFPNAFLAREGLTVSL
jgi:hypothetical protein